MWAIRDKRPHASMPGNNKKVMENQNNINTRLRKQMKQLDTKYDLENTLACEISEWFETGHVSLFKYP